jgi:hypothetical protein
MCTIMLNNWVTGKVIYVASGGPVQLCQRLTDIALKSKCITNRLLASEHQTFKPWTVLVPLPIILSTSVYTVKI